MATERWSKRSKTFTGNLDGGCRSVQCTILSTYIVNIFIIMEKKIVAYIHTTKRPASTGEKHGHLPHAFPQRATESRCAGTPSVTPSIPPHHCQRGQYSLSWVNHDLFYQFLIWKYFPLLPVCTYRVLPRAPLWIHLDASWGERTGEQRVYNRDCYCQNALQRSCSPRLYR